MIIDIINFKDILIIIKFNNVLIINIKMKLFLNKFRLLIKSFKRFFFNFSF